MHVLCLFPAFGRVTLGGLKPAGYGRVFRRAQARRLRAGLFGGLKPAGYGRVSSAG
jgi:hypothetical protein